MNNLIKVALLSSIAAISTAGVASASTIISAVGATVDVGGSIAPSDINDTFNQNGLSANYTSGLTDFDSFVASTTHTLTFVGFEWFSEQNVTDAQVTYDLGASFSIDALALWNEEFSGIGTLDLSVSNDNLSFTNIATGLNPTNNPLNADYGADVFSFAATSFQFIRFNMSNCPQPNAQFNGCSIGEVAFRSAAVPPVPVPAGLPLILTGLAGFGLLRRKRAK